MLRIYLGISGSVLSFHPTEARTPKRLAVWLVDDHGTGPWTCYPRVGCFGYQCRGAGGATG